MANQWEQHLGDNDLVYGMPKHMSAVAGEDDGPHLKVYWRYHPKPNACKKCQAMEGLWFEKKPEPVHDFCKCEIEQFTIHGKNGEAIEDDKKHYKVAAVENHHHVDRTYLRSKICFLAN